MGCDLDFKGITSLVSFLGSQRPQSHVLQWCALTVSQFGGTRRPKTTNMWGLSSPYVGAREGRPSQLLEVP